MTISMLHSLTGKFYTENRQDKTRRQSSSNCVNSTISTHICDKESVLFIIPFSTTEQVWHQARWIPATMTPMAAKAWKIWGDVTENEAVNSWRQQKNHNNKPGTSYPNAHPSNPDEWSSTDSWGPTRNHLGGPKIFGLVFCGGYFSIKAVPLEHSMVLDGKITVL